MFHFFQTFVILVGTIAICVIGISTVGGIEKILDVTRRDQRDVAIDLTFDLKKPYTLWSAIFAFPFLSLTQSAIAQYYAQRFLVVETLAKARFTAVAGQFISAIFLVVYVFIGLVMYTYFAGCDPYRREEIQREDQLFPLFLADLFQNYSGCVGLMMAAFISTSLSTASSGVNALAAMTHSELSEFLLRDPTPRQRIIFTKFVALFMGCIIIGIAFLGGLITGIVDTVITWSGILITPILAVFLLGMFSRSATSTGALVGVFSSTAIGIWLRLWNVTYADDSSLPPLYTDECNDVTGTAAVTMTTNVSIEQLHVLENQREEDAQVINDVGSLVTITTLWLYQLSSVYYHTISCLITWVVGLIVSCFTDQDPVADQLVVWPKWFTTASSGRKDEPEEEMGMLLDDMEY